MLNPSSKDHSSKTQKQILLMTLAEELMTEARNIFQKINKQSPVEDFSEEISLMLNNCERAYQIIDQIPEKEVLPERLHMTQSVRNSITSQTIFYRNWIAEYLDSQSKPKEPKNTPKSPEKESFKQLLAQLCLKERKLVSFYEQQKKSGMFQEVLDLYRKLLFSLIDFAEAYMASKFDQGQVSKFQKRRQFNK